MDQEREPVRVLFVNKFGPLSNAITGQTAVELAAHLKEKGFDISFLSIRATYRAGKRDVIQNTVCKVTELWSSYNGDQPLLRFSFSLLDGLRLFVRSLFYKKDILVVMTEPPLLFFWFQLFRWMYRAKLVYWTMDVYPEAFVSGTFTSSRNPVYKLIRRIVYRKPPDFIIALGNEQYKFVASKFPHPPPHDIIPCGVVSRAPHPEWPAQATGKIQFGYIGNLGAAHDAAFLSELIEQLDPDRHQIVLCLYGTKADMIRRRFAKSSHIAYKQSLSYDEIEKLDVNIASLLPAWDHVCVPSKAVTAICCGSTLLLNGSDTVDNWIMLQEAGWIIRPGISYTDQVQAFLLQLTREEINTKRNKAREIAAHCVKEKQNAFARIHSQLLVLMDNTHSVSNPVR